MSPSPPTDPNAGGADGDGVPAEHRGVSGILKALGPGVVTGASDDDPSGIATYAQVGARFGLSMVWTALLTLPLMAAVQEICDRTALATGESLGVIVRKHFPRPARAVVLVLLVVLAVANVLNIAADLVAIGAGMNLLHAGPIWLWALLAGTILTGLLLSGSFAVIEKVFKVLCLSLLTYLIVLAVVGVNWSQVAVHTLIPHLQTDSAYLALLVGVLGTTISPYLFFWQSGHRIEDMREEGDTATATPLKERTTAGAGRKQLIARIDVFGGMFLSNAVMFAIIVVTASTIGKDGPKQIDSAAQAADALKPLAGSLSKVLFALGFIGTGMLAVPVLAGAASIGISGLTGRKWGFSQSPRKAPLFYLLVAAGTAGGTVLTLLHVNPIELLVLSAVINGIAAVPFLIIIMIIASRRSIMGTYRNGALSTILGWTTVALMTTAALALLLA